MAKEIEKKFLIYKDLFDNCAYTQSILRTSTDIKQGYLLDINHHTLRIRLTDNTKAILTYKGPSIGITRTEIEFRIPLVIGKLLQKCCSRVLHKTRLKIPTIETDHGLATTYWEVDEFHNLDEPLILAEIELPSEDTEFSRPEWLRQDVSEDPGYYNSSLINKVK